jgi:hypothetical protein
LCNLIVFHYHGYMQLIAYLVLVSNHGPEKCGFW